VCELGHNDRSSQTSHSSGEPGVCCLQLPVNVCSRLAHDPQTNDLSFWLLHPLLFSEVAFQMIFWEEVDEEPIRRAYHSVLFDHIALGNGYI
jgi:hypothetical protein